MSEAERERVVAPFGSLKCSFCGKSSDQVQKLVVSDIAGICEGCIGMAIDVCLVDGITPHTWMTPSDTLERRAQLALAQENSHDER